MSLKRLAVVVCSSIVWMFIVSASSSARTWWENSGEKQPYDLSRFRILIVIGGDFDYLEATEIQRFWEDWGAKVDVADTGRELTGHVWRLTDKGFDRSVEKRITTDVLLPRVHLARYAALFFPGGGSPKSLLARDSLAVVRLIRDADKRGLVISAICHGPHVLASAGILEGRRATGHPEITGMIEASGGTYVNAVSVTDGNIVTGNWPYFETMAVKVAERLLYPKGGGPSEISPSEANPVLKSVKERRSVREFLDRPVDSTTVAQILRAGTWAPSPNNDQPWRFVVVRAAQPKQRIAEAIERVLAGYYEKRGFPPEALRGFVKNVWAAPVHVFAFAEHANVEQGTGWEDVQRKWNVHWVWAACQNMLFAAESMNLGSLWIGMSLLAEDEVKEILHAPREAELVAAIAIGYPAVTPLPPVRRALRSAFRMKAGGEGSRRRGGSNGNLTRR